MAAKGKRQEDEIEDSADESAEEGKSVGGKKKIIIILAVVLLLVGAGAGVFFSGILGGGDTKEETAEAATDEHAAADDGHGEAGGHGEDGKPGEIKLDEHGNPIGGPIYMELPEFLVNLSSPGGKTSFMKMRVTLELATPKAKLVAEANKPRIQDAFNTYLREMRPSDLAGSAGIYRLREELLTRVNKALEPEVVKDILFGEIIVQ